MNLETIMLVLVLATLAVTLYFVTRKPKTDQGMQVMMEWLKEMRAGSESMQKRLDERLGETNKVLSDTIQNTNKAVNERLDKAAQYIAGLQKELGNMSQIGPDIRRLSEVLASPKARGNFGEEMLEQLIREVLPNNNYQFQYRFRNGEIVDAIVKLNQGYIIPIDSKFSLENYRLFKEAKTDDAAENLRKSFLKDVKKRIDEIHKKYILPQEGTLDFAFMYVPSEGVFSEILDDAGINEYSREKRVYFVSPNNLYHQLRLVLLYLNREKINQVAHELQSMIIGIRQESDKFGRNLDVLANHIKNASNSMGVINVDYAKLKMSIGNAANLKLDTKGGEPEKLLEN